jgi:hypothetical protein
MFTRNIRTRYLRDSPPAFHLALNQPRHRKRAMDLAEHARTSVPREIFPDKPLRFRDAGATLVS